MLVEMQVADLTMDPMTEMPIIILKDSAGKNPLPIWIGVVEASAIATQLEHIELSRPTSHDLIRNLLSAVGVRLVQIEITDLQDNTYYGNLVLQQGEQQMRVEARPSDAIALAMRVGCPILVEESVVEKAREIDLRQPHPARSKLDADAAREVLASLPDEQFGKWKM